jgi:hypothetical protein
MGSMSVRDITMEQFLEEQRDIAFKRMVEQLSRDLTGGDQDDEEKQDGPK